MKRRHLLTLCLSPALSALVPTALGADAPGSAAPPAGQPAQEAVAQEAAAATSPTTLSTASLAAPTSLDEKRQLIRRWEEDIDRLRERLAEFRAEAMLTPTGGDGSMPEPVPGEATIDCDGGLLFDVNAAQLIYVNNVRLSEQRLRLRADLQLLVQLERRQLDEKLNREGDTYRRGKKPGADASGGNAIAPEQAADTANSPDREVAKDAGKGEAESLSGADQGDSSSKEGDAARRRERVCTVSTTSALADTEKNRLLLSTRGGQQPIVITGENQQLTLRSNDQRHASLLADEHGDALAVCGSLHLEGLDRDGQPYTLDAEQGEAWYNAAARSLTVAGPCHLRHARGELRCRDGLTLYFDGEGKAETKAGGGYMSQFASMQLSGIRRAEAHGNVRFVSKATEDQPACTAAAEHLDYDATNGDCRLSGPDSSLEYGGYALSRAETMHLAPNGDITLTGPELLGRYERKGSDDRPLTGQFTAAQELRFTAADGCIRTEHGLKLRDSEIDFACSGPVTLTLAKREKGKAAPERAKTGMLNLAIADYSDIAHIDARGDVVGHFADAGEGAEAAPGTAPAVAAGTTGAAGSRSAADRSETARAESSAKSGSSLRGDHLVADLVKGSALVEAPESREASLSYRGNSVSASSPDAGDEAPRLIIAENGDLLAVGGRIRAHLLTDEGPADADCRGKMELIRADRLITTGPDATVNAPAGLFSANGPLVLTLAPEESAAQPADGAGKPAAGTGAETEKSDSGGFAARYPHLNYAYSGLQRLRTEQGGTARTVQASMECSGLIDISLLPESRRAKNAVMGPIDKALLCDRVSVLAKDSSGRLLRASGDRMEADAATGEKVITGRRVTLSDENNTHIASGAGAAVRIDRNNNARITGQHQSTTATNIRRQTEQTKTATVGSGARKPAADTPHRSH